MNLRFNNFSPEAMRAFGQELADGLQRRAEFLHQTRNHTFTMLSDFRKEQAGAETKRRERASREADARRLFMSELKSGVHSLLGRFELSRKEVAEDLQGMAREFHAACDAFQARHGHQGDHFRGEPGGPHPKHPLKSQPARPSSHPFRPAAEAHDGPKASASPPPSRPASEGQDGAKPRSGPDDKPGDAKKPQG
jgi:hypothetical protein